VSIDLNSSSFLKPQLPLSYMELPEGPRAIGPDNFKVISCIGKGSFGDVYLVSETKSGKKFAMKVLSKQKIIGNNLIKYAMSERNVLSVSVHPFIVKLSYAFQNDDDLFLILQYCPLGDLSKLLQSHGRFQEGDARIYVAEILTAIAHLHKYDIIYRDLKPENIVIDERGHAMLTDFGLSKEGIQDAQATKTFCGSLVYLAPELLDLNGHGKAVDWYHLGILLYEMLTGSLPFVGKDK